MRNLSPHMQDVLDSQYGNEPIIILEVAWTSKTTLFYSDKIVSKDIRGRILSVGSIDDVVNISKSSNSQSVTIVLSDTTGGLKKDYDRIDIHKRPAKLWQYFGGHETHFKFLLFEGVISSPIIWKEGDRTLSFDILSKLEDVETGFSAEEGTFSSIPDYLIGKTWPLPFGTCLTVPCLMIDPIPTGISLDSNAATDFQIENQTIAMQQKIDLLKGQATLAFNTALAAYATGREGLSVDSYWQDQGDQFTQQGNQFLQQIYQIQQDMFGLNDTMGAQQSYQNSTMNIGNGLSYPQNVKLQASLGGVRLDGTMAGDSFQVNQVIHPLRQGVNPLTGQVPPGFSDNTVTVPGQTPGTTVTKALSGFTNPQTTTYNTAKAFGDDVIKEAGFIWIQAGEVLKLHSVLPVRYMAAMLPCTIHNVWAFRNISGARLLARVPTNYYSVSTKQTGPYVCTFVTVVRPLSYYNLGWEDDLYVDLTSPVGPNTADILQWIIQQWSHFGVDETSFAIAHGHLGNFPSNFCLLERKNIIGLLQEIAYQARCSIYLKNGLFYLTYLPVEPAAVDTITEVDVILNSLEIDCTPTEDVITKFIVNYKTYYAQEKDNYIILKNNDPKYGIVKETAQWYIYNVPQLVELAVTYWMMIKSNTWKIVKFRTPLHKFKLETFDYIDITFASHWLAKGTVRGRIDSVVLDSDKRELEFTVWVPVRVGEMIKYDFVYPGDTTKAYNANTNFIAIEPNQDDMKSQNGSKFPGINYTFDRINRPAIGNGTSDLTGGAVDHAVHVLPSIGPLNALTEPSFDYRFRQYNVGTFTGGQGTAVTVPAQILTSLGGDDYKVALYFKGAKGGTTVTTATNMNPSASVGPGAWVMCCISTTSNQQGGFQVYRMFVPAVGRSVYPGQVLSGTGAGPYSTKIWRNGLAGSNETINAKQLQIDPTDTIPSGTYCFVLESQKIDPTSGKTSPEYYIQVPIYLE